MVVKAGADVEVESKERGCAYAVATGTLQPSPHDASTLTLASFWPVDPFFGRFIHLLISLSRAATQNNRRKWRKYCLRRTKSTALGNTGE